MKRMVLLLALLLALGNVHASEKNLANSALGIAYDAYRFGQYTKAFEYARKALKGEGYEGSGLNATEYKNKTRRLIAQIYWETGAYEELNRFTQFLEETDRNQFKCMLSWAQSDYGMTGQCFSGIGDYEQTLRSMRHSVISTWNELLY